MKKEKISYWKNCVASYANIFVESKITTFRLCEICCSFIFHGGI